MILPLHSVGYCSSIGVNLVPAGIYPDYFLPEGDVMDGRIRLEECRKWNDSYGFRTEDCHHFLGLFRSTMSWETKLHTAGELGEECGLLHGRVAAAVVASTATVTLFAGRWVDRVLAPGPSVRLQLTCERRGVLPGL
jgi:hypothetical protein